MGCGEVIRAANARRGVAQEIGCSNAQAKARRSSETRAATRLALCTYSRPTLRLSTWCWPLELLHYCARTSTLNGCHPVTVGPSSFVYFTYVPASAVSVCPWTIGTKICPGAVRILICRNLSKELGNDFYRVFFGDYRSLDWYASCERFRRRFGIMLVNSYPQYRNAGVLICPHSIPSRVRLPASLRSLWQIEQGGMSDCMTLVLVNMTSLGEIQNQATP